MTGFFEQLDKGLQTSNNAPQQPQVPEQFHDLSKPPVTPQPNNPLNPNEGKQDYTNDPNYQAFIAWQKTQGQDKQPNQPQQPVEPEKPTDTKQPKQPVNYSSTYDIALEGTGIAYDDIEVLVTDAVNQGKQIDTTILDNLDATQKSRVRAVINEVQTNYQNEVNSVREMAHNLAGSKEQWDTYVQAFKNAPAEMQDMVQFYGERNEKQKAINYVIKQCNELGLVSNQQGTPLNGGYNTTQHLTRSGFIEETQKLHTEFGNNFMSDPKAVAKYEQLCKQRSLSRNAGY